MKNRILIFVGCTVVTYIAGLVQLRVAESLIEHLSTEAARRRLRATAATIREDVEHRSACDRIHPHEPCRPGQNHPDAAPTEVPL